MSLPQESISASRFRPLVRLNEGDKVAFNGWIGSIRSLEEDRVTIITEDGKVDFDDDDDNRQVKTVPIRSDYILGKVF